MKRWFLFFVVSIGVGGFFALIVALGRTPVISDLIPPRIFYHWLVGHVDSALIIGLLTFLFSLWHKVFGGEGRLYDLVLCGLGFSLLVITSFFGFGTALYNNYVPTVVHPLFLTGMALFGTGYLLITLRFLRTALKDVLSEDPLRSALSVSVLTSLLTLLSVVFSLLQTQKGEPALYFERLYWIPGHLHQFVNASLLISCWVILTDLAGKSVPTSFRFVNLSLLPFPLILIAVQLKGLDPISEEVKSITTIGYAVGIGLPTLTYTLYLTLKVAFRGGFYGYVLGLSTTLYLIGAGMGYLIAGSDLRIPAHYHGVIASILIAIMGITYSLLEEMGYLGRIPSLIKAQPIIYWFGMLLFVIGLFWAGVYGAPRKVFGTDYIENLKVYVFMGVMGLGSVLSVLGGVLFVLFVIYSILKPRKGVRHAEKGTAQQEG